MTRSCNNDQLRCRYCHWHYMYTFYILLQALNKHISHRYTMTVTNKLFSDSIADQNITRGDPDYYTVQFHMSYCKKPKTNGSKQIENKLIEIENNHSKEMNDLHNKYSIEINDLKLRLQCEMNEFNEYKQKTNEENIINNNNNNVLIDNLKRENAMLIEELSNYKQNISTPSKILTDNNTAN